MGGLKAIGFHGARAEDEGLAGKSFNIEIDNWVGKKAKLCKRFYLLRWRFSVLSPCFDNRLTKWIQELFAELALEFYTLQVMKYSAQPAGEVMKRRLWRNTCLCFERFDKRSPIRDRESRHAAEMFGDAGTDPQACFASINSLDGLR
jgi:hypothetical protein